MSEKSIGSAQDTLSSASSKPSVHYDKDFVLTDEYRASMPDMQNEGSRQIFGANVPILKVGISNFRLPLRYITPDSDTHTLETSVTGTVSLEAGHKGINMSRIMRVFYDYESHIYPGFVGGNPSEYKKTLRAHRAQLKLDFDYPILQTSLRSGLEDGSTITVHTRARLMN